MTANKDIATLARQLADLTVTIETMGEELNALRERADNQQERADSQQELPSDTNKSVLTSLHANSPRSASVCCRLRRTLSENQFDPLARSRPIDA